jgi:photosystem II stability/assembly factor-like uncharacterized protein
MCSLPVPRQEGSQRWRRVGLVALSVLVIASAGVIYVRSGSSATGTRVAPPPSGRNPVRYSFVSPSVGWAAVNPFFPSGSADLFHVFRTVDGGRHWQQQLTGETSGPGLTPITVRFFDKSHGYITVAPAFLGVRFYRTSDGGNSWNEIPPPAPRIVGVAFTDARHAWALAQDLAQQTSGQLFDLYATGDGGVTWERLPNPPRDAYYMEVRSLTEAWMGSLGPGPPHVYRSVDAGRSWQVVELPPPPGRSWDSGGHGTTVQMLPEYGVAATTGISTTPPNVSEPALFTSFDLGSSWRYVAPPPGEVAYQDASHWWAIKDTTLSKSTDAGQSWKRITDTLPAWQFVPHTLDSNHASAELTVVGGFGLALTSDGGLHWTRQNVPPD